ncbi:hypothetical protein ACFO3O_15535 [Dokdonia ponticola]|uniref:Uncharacterized protein n=1 Tax=Dokdonia ponticola TaxID=2041041 RepID=A0ABV9HYS7_9FLAO
MKKSIIILLVILQSCKPNNELSVFLTAAVPGDIPIEFKEELIPENKIIHRGVFSPDLEHYYYTISDTSFQNFDVFRISKMNGAWSNTKKAFFNSDYNDHGMSFSPNGNTLYFSSTRPTEIEGVSATWHIWKSDKINGKWSEPVFVDIPNLRNKLVSHPTLTNSGTLYFHSSNLDYSEMNIYKSKEYEGKFSDAEKFIPLSQLDNGACTPYVSPKEDYLIFARIDNQLDLMISFNDGKGHWSNPRKLSEKTNTHGQGNPYVTPDNKFLFFTTGKEASRWRIQWVNIERELENH